MQHYQPSLFMYRHKVVLVIALVVVAGACAPANTKKLPLATQPALFFTPGIGVLGDSMSDEYRADDARGGAYAETTLNWIELLSKARGLNFGKWGTWGSPRRTGYEYNWAQTGATINSMIVSGQHTGLAHQIAEGKVSYVIIWIGNNDFHLKNGPYEEIYSGKLSGVDLQNKIDNMVKDIATALDTIVQAGDVHMGIVTIADQGAVPQAKILFPDPQKRKRVSDAVAAVNIEIKKIAETRGAILLDSNAISRSLFENIDILGNLSFGEQKITVLIKGDEPHHLQLSDNIGHAGTVLSGIIANSIFIEPFNASFGINLELLTEEEILSSAGIE